MKIPSSELIVMLIITQFGDTDHGFFLRSGASSAYWYPIPSNGNGQNCTNRLSVLPKNNASTVHPMVSQVCVHVSHSDTFSGWEIFCHNATLQSLCSCNKRSVLPSWLMEQDKFHISVVEYPYMVMNDNLVSSSMPSCGMSTHGIGKTMCYGTHTLVAKPIKVYHVYNAATAVGINHTTVSVQLSLTGGGLLRQMILECRSTIGHADIYDRYSHDPLQEQQVLIANDSVFGGLFDPITTNSNDAGQMEAGIGHMGHLLRFLGNEQRVLLLSSC